MKFVKPKTKHTRQRAALDQRPRPTREHFTKPMVEPHGIHTYAELRQQIHDDLRSQHPEWVLPNGECPKCDAYEARLRQLLETSTSTDRNEWVVALHHALQRAVN
jgi:hypothetical protein